MRNIFVVILLLMSFGFLAYAEVGKESYGKGVQKKGTVSKEGETGVKNGSDSEEDKYVSKLNGTYLMGK